MTVIKPSSGRVAGASDDKEKRIKHRYNPYGAGNGKERSHEQWKDKKRTEKVPHPLHNASPSTIRKHLLSTLSDESNPITHSDIGLRSDHVVSAATGHQRSDGRGSARQYYESRKQKLEYQTPSKGSALFSNVRVYINGYLRDTTDIEMKRIVAQAGGEVLHTASRATHILTSQQLSGSKTHRLLTTKSKVKVHVVKPEWILDSIKAGKRLKERKYSMVADKTNKDLIDMFGK